LPTPGLRCACWKATPPDLVEVRSTLSDIVDDNKRAAEVIRRLRGLLRKGEVQLSVLDLNGLIRDVAKLLSSDAIIRNIAVRLELDPNPLFVSGDAVQLQQVVLNLLLNAMEAMAEGPADGRDHRADREHRGRDRPRIGAGRRAGARRGHARPDIRAVLQHEAFGGGHGPSDLEVHHRAPRWTDLGHGQRDRRCDLPLLASPRRQEVEVIHDGVTSRCVPAYLAEADTRRRTAGRS
jgi:hypothetical protein